MSVNDVSESVHEAFGEEIDALATRYELVDGAAKALRELVRLVDWGQPNFVPKLDSSDRARSEENRFRKKRGRLVLNTLAESLAGLEFERVRTARQLADVGSGAGFPGLVLAIALPQARVALIEKRNETCVFLRHAVAELGLDNVQVIEARVQQWFDGLLRYDVATSRNAASPDATVKLSAPLLEPGGAAVVWQKGRRNPVKEVLAATAAYEAGLRLEQVQRSEFSHEDRVNVKHLYLYAKANGASEFNQRAREALARIEQVQKADGLKKIHRKVAPGDQPAESSPESVHGRIGEEIKALAARYQLTEASTDALQEFVRLVDWGAMNFVPRPDLGDGTRQRRHPKHRSRIACNVLAESLFGLELEPVRAARRLADIGSGAGFPGLVLAIALPQARVALVEGGSEKCAFLRRAVAELGLENVEVVEGRARHWSAGVGSCDVVISRKSGHLDVMVEWSAPLVAPGGTIVLWPGTSDFAEEAVAAAAETADAAGLSAQVHALPSQNRHGEPILKHLHLYARQSERHRSPT